MFDAALEYRRFLQKERSLQEKEAKLAALAAKSLQKTKSKLSLQEEKDEIYRRYQSGDDLLDPAIFERESIEEFALKFKIQNDPQVVQFISMAKTRDEWQSGLKNKRKGIWMN